MKKFETPEIEVTKFAVEDVITTSGEDNEGGEGGGGTTLPDDEF